MKNISINELQTDLSKVVKEVGTGEVFEIMRYSKPVAYLVSKESYEKLQAGENCKACVEDLRKIGKKLKS